MAATDRPPQDDRHQRKLIAVLYADMVGYSRLIDLDDIGTLKRLRTLRRCLIDPAVTDHGGKIVQTGGDSLLVVFDSIDGAVRCAVRVQQQVPLQDGDLPPDRAIRFRIGINIGDAIANETDLHGNSVNVAQRLQAISPPGGICVSRSVRDHVQESLDLTFDELGPLRLKNIARPVEAFLLRHEAVNELGSSEPPPIDHSPKTLPPGDKPSIAVLAFTNMSDDPNQEYFADGISDDIITELSRGQSLLVIARNSSFTYKGRVIDVKRIASELSVRYVVEGSVRRDGNRLRVSARLIDAEVDRHIWAERFDRPLMDLFSVQDEITTAVVAAIDPAIAQAERQRAMQKPLERLSAWETWQRALWHLSKHDLPTTENFIQRALALDQSFAPAHASLAWLYLLKATEGAGVLQQSAQLAEAEARLAITLDPDNAAAHASLGRSFFYQGDEASALEEIETALTLSASDPQAHLAKGRVLLYSGKLAAARTSLTTALRLDPLGPTAPTVTLQFVMSYYLERDYRAAASAGRRMIRSNPGRPSTYLWLAASLGQLGETHEACAALDALIAVAPHYYEYLTGSRPVYVRREDHDHILEGLSKSGWKRPLH